MGHYLDEMPSVNEKSVNLECPLGNDGDMDEAPNKENVDIENNIELCKEIGEDVERVPQHSAEVDQVSDDVEGNITELCSTEENSQEECENLKSGDEALTKLDFEPDEENFSGSNRSNKENVLESHKSRKSSSKSGTKKISKNQIKEERLKIHSETQRLMREREISIPYHIPKQRTLKEFLSRKKNRANIPLNTPSSKMVEIWKDIEESTKNAFEFFKSDSESDTEAQGSEKSIQKTEEPEKTPQDFAQDCGSVNNVDANNDSGSDGIKDQVGVAKDGVNMESVTKNISYDVNKEDSNLLVNDCENSMPLCEEVRTGGDSLTKDCSDENHLTEDSVQVENDCTMSKDDPSVSVEIVKESSTNPEIIETSVEILEESSVDEKYARERTSDWVKNIPVYEKLLKPNKKEMLLQKLNPKLLTITPKLSGEADSFIDLENVKNGIEVGAKNLKKRFLENCIAPRRKPTNESELTIVSSETNDKGEISQITTEKLIYNSTEVLNDPGLDKPGAKLQRLREELKKKIEEKWEEEHKKRILEVSAKGKDGFEEVAVEEEEEELLEDVDSDSSESSEDETEESEPEEEDIVEVSNKSKKKRNEFIDSEAEESECEDEESGNEGGDEMDDVDCVTLDGDESSGMQATVAHRTGGFPGNTFSDTQCSLIPPYQPGGGMLNGGSELSQCDDNPLPKNILSPTLGLSLDLSPAHKNSSNPGSQQPWDIDLEMPEESNNRSNFVPCFPENANFDLSDAYEFCSGKFPDEVGASQDSQVREDYSQDCAKVIDLDSGTSRDKSPVPLKDTCESKEEEKTLKQRSRLQILSDDSDDEADPKLDDVNEDITVKRIASDDSDDESGTHRKGQKTRRHLQFSDEEDNSEAIEGDDGDSEVEDEESSQNDDPDREVEYDSEEAEIVNPTEFFEKEAELSGSEWSGDEDEKDLDKLEMEDGDEDKLDDKEVRSQLEKIHMRRILDDDARDVRLLQELLFEDGDLFDDGPKREKNFRWKDLGAFFDDDGNVADMQNGFGQEELDEDEESRKERHEKELFLMQLKNKREEMDSDEEVDGKSLLKLGKVILERSRRVTTVSNRTVTRSVTHEVEAVTVKTPFGLTNQRGSFLSRNEEFLSRLAKFTSNATDNILGPKHSKNFVFATKSPEKVNPSSKENSHPKRKNTSPRGEMSKSKRSKMDASVKSSILDRLT